MGMLMVLQKPFLAVYPSATLTAWYYAVGSVFTMIMCAFSGVELKDFYLTGRLEVREDWARRLGGVPCFWF